MSKIYEALLRAEIDRLTATKNGTDAVALSRTNSAVAEDTRPTVTTAGSPAVSGVTTGAGPLTVDIETRTSMPEFGVPEFGVPEFNGPGVSGPEFASVASTVPYAAAPLHTEDPAGSLETTLGGIARVPWSPDLTRLPSLQQRGSTVEQIRALRSRMHEFRHLNSIKTLLISSGLPEEGKSFVTANLAISFANYKHSRVLLIDGDMRRGTLHKLLGTHQGPGLTEFLSGKASVTEIVQQAKPTEEGARLASGLSSLFFIPCGADAENAADLSGNGRFEKLLTQVSPAFDWVVVDSSPVNLVADGANLARACDGVVLVTRGGVTKYETAQRALHELKAAKVLGVVLNAVTDVPAAGGYYGYES